MMEYNGRKKNKDDYIYLSFIGMHNDQNEWTMANVTFSVKINVYFGYLAPSALYANRDCGFVVLYKSSGCLTL